MVTKQEIIDALRCSRYTEFLADRIEAEGIAPPEYVPMTDDELDTITKMQWGNSTMMETLLTAFRANSRQVEQAVIKRYREQMGVDNG